MFGKEKPYYQAPAGTPGFLGLGLTIAKEWSKLMADALNIFHDVRMARPSAFHCLT